MVQKNIERTEQRCIFLIQDDNVSFYLLIPNSKKVNLVLGLYNHANEETAKNIPSILEKSIIIPILSDSVLDSLKNSQSSFERLDKYFSYLINLTYKILNYNHIEVDNLILLNENKEYDAFNRWFVQKYRGRVELISLTNTSKVSTNTQIPNRPQEDIPISSIADIENSNSFPENNYISEQNKEPGFVSYILLGVVIAIFSLLFLYFIL